MSLLSKLKESDQLPTITGDKVTLITGLWLWTLVFFRFNIVQGQPLKSFNSNLDGLPAFEIIQTDGSKLGKIYADSVLPLAPGVLTFCIKDRWGLYAIGEKKFFWFNVGLSKKPTWNEKSLSIYTVGPDTIISLFNQKPAVIVKPPDSLGVYFQFIKNWDKKWVKLFGFSNAITNENLTQPIFDSIGEKVSSTVFKTKFNGKWGISTVYGKWWVAPMYNSLSSVTDSLYICRSDTGFHLAGKNLSSWNFAPRDSLWIGKDGYPRFKYRGRLGITNKNGLLLARDCYYISMVSDSVFSYQLGPLWGISKVNGVKFLPPSDKFQYLKWFRPKYFLARTRNYYGFADIRGTIRISTRYERVKDFNEGIFALRVNKFWGVANLREEFLVNPRFDSIQISCGGIIWGKKGNQTFLLNNEGKTIVASDSSLKMETTSNTLKQASFSTKHSIYLLQQGLPVMVNGNDWEGGIWAQGNKLGYFDKKGTIIIQPDFEALSQLNDGSFMAKLNGKWGILNSEGLPTVPFLYKEMIYDSFSHLLVLPPQKVF